MGTGNNENNLPLTPKTIETIACSPDSGIGTDLLNNSSKFRKKDNGSSIDSSTWIQSLNYFRNSKALFNGIDNSCFQTTNSKNFNLKNSNFLKFYYKF